MKIIIVLAFIIFSDANLFAQKKLVPVSQSQLTGIALPAGSKKDSRMLSVAAAEVLLEMETSKSKSTQKIKTCFTILENLVVDKGPRDIYVRVLSPDGAVMSTSQETFDVNGQATLYTTKESIIYENRNTDLCVYWDKGGKYTPGRYNIELYCDGSPIGATSLTLK